MKKTNFLRNLWLWTLFLVMGTASAQNVAKIGSTEYATFAAAVNAATDGQTITLLADIEDADNINLPAGVTLDGANHKISGNSAIHINAAGGAVKNVVFENIHNTSTPSSSDITKYNLPADKVGTLSAIYANGLTGELSITGCSFDNVDWDAIQITPTEGCTISIVDNTFRHTNIATSQLRYVHIETASYIDAVVTVTDNKFYDSKSGFTICDLGVYKVRKSKDARLSGNWLETITNYDMTYPEMVYPARSQADDDVDDICPAAKKVVAPIEFYNTLQEAFDALVDLQLVKNTDEDVTVPASYNKQLQTEGFNINSTITNNGALYIIASNSDEVCTGKVINNGSLKSSNLAQLNGLQIVNNGKFEITGSTNAADLSTITNNEGGIIEISGGTYNAKPNDEWILWGYEAVDNGNGTFTVQKRVFANGAEALAAGAVAKYTKSSVTEYINTLANGSSSNLYFLKDVEEDVTRTGSTTNFYAEDFKYTGSLDATGKTVCVKSGKAEFNSLKSAALNIGSTGKAGVEVSVHDGKVTGKITVYSPAVLNMDGGTFTNTSATAAVAVNSGATLTITGGTFKSAQFKDYIANGYEAVDNGDGTWTVKKENKLVSIEVHEEVEISGTETATEDEKAAATTAVEALESNTAVTAEEATNVAEAEDVTILAITIKEVTVQTTPAVDETPATATITKITYDVQPMNGETAVNKTAQPLTFRLPVPQSFKSEIVKVSHKHNGVTTSTYETVLGEGANKYVELASDKFSEWTLEDINPNTVAVIGETQYASLQDAITAANAKDEIILIADQEISSAIEISKNLTLNLNGKTIINNVASNRLFRVGGVTFTIDGTVEGSSMIIPETNKYSFGFVDMRNMSGDASSDAKLVLNGGYYEGATLGGAFFKGRNHNQTFELNDVHCKCTAGDGQQYYANGYFYNGDNASVVNSYGYFTILKVVGGLYEHATLAISAPNVFQGKNFMTDGKSSVSFDDVKIISTHGPIYELSSGEMTINNCDFTIEGAATWENSAICASNNATLNVNGGKYNAPYAVYALTSGATININGGEFTGSESILVAGTDNHYENAVSTINVSDGTFTYTGSNPSNAYETYGNRPTNIAISGGTFNVEIPNEYCAEGFVPVDNGNGIYGVKEYTYVAQIGDDKYVTLAEAVDAVPADNTETTIVMIADETISGNAGVTIPAGKNIVLDLNGKTVKNAVNENKASQVILNKGTLTIEDNSAEGTGLLTNAIEEGSATGDWWSNPKANYATNVITNNGTLTITSGKILETATSSICYAIDNNSSAADAILNLKGGNITSLAPTTIRLFCNSTTKENQLNMSETSAAVVEGSYTALWIQLPGSSAQKKKGTLNIAGGTLTGGTYAFYDYSYGDLYDEVKYNLSGGTFNGSYAFFSYGANIDITGGVYNGEVAIKQVKPSEVSVSGGMFGGDVYTYGDNATEKFISGGVFAITTYEYQGNTYYCDWLYQIVDGYEACDNTNPATKEQYPYMVARKVLIFDVPESVEVAVSPESTEAEQSAAIAAVEELNSNAKVTDDDATNVTELEDVHTLVIKVVSASVETKTVEEVVTATVTQVTYDVQPYKNDEKVNVTEQPITFRLPVPQSFKSTLVKVSHKHNEVTTTTYETVQGEGADKFVALSSDKFSEWTIEDITFGITELTVYVGDSTPRTMSILEFLETQKTQPNAMAAVSSDYIAEVTGITNVIVDYAVGKNGHYYECEKFVLDDMYDWYTPVDFIALSGSYSRECASSGLNSVCVPFALDANNIPAGASLKVFNMVDENYTNVYFSTYASIEAGRPCLMDGAAGIWNVTFNETQISASTIQSSFAGSYITHHLGEGYYKAANGQFAHTNSDSHVYPFRAYLAIDKSGGMVAEVKELNLIFNDTETGISSAAQDSNIEAIYSVNGVMHSKMTKGVNIVRKKDGSFKKILMKK